MLLTYSVLGAAVFEDSVLVAAGLGEDPTARADYRAWLASLVTKHLEGSDP